MKLGLSAVALVVMLTLAGCDAKDTKASGDPDSAGAALDKLAIEKGLIPDGRSLAFEGRFEAQSELGTDKFCAVSNGGSDYRVGFLSVYGPESKCEAKGNAQQEGDAIRIKLEGKGACSFTASYDGIILRFPGNVPDGCATYCSKNASMSGTRYYFVEPGADAAKQTLGRELDRLCA